MLSNAAWSLRAKASTGTCRLTGRIATVFRLTLLRPSSANRDWAVDEESNSSLTREAIVRNSLENKWICGSDVRAENAHWAVICGVLRHTDL
jgi:hypothetical protein